MFRDSANLFRNILPAYNIHAHFVDPAAFQSALNDSAKLIYVARQLTID